MKLPRIWVRLSCAGMFVLLTAAPSRGVITALMPLKAVLADSPFIVVAKIDKFYPDKPAMVLTVTADLKGKTPFRRLPVNLAGRSAAAKKEVAALLKRLGPDLPVILFMHKQRAKVMATFAYSNGTWFQITGRQTGDAHFAWGFAHCEPYLRRTFKGTTAELRKVIEDSVAGKKDPPPPDEKEEPGLGPELKKTSFSGEPEASARRQANGTLFAVIPTLGVGGPLAILAILFPSVFGGVFVLFRRWLAFFTVVSVISLVYFLHVLCYGWLRGTWWGQEDALWLVMTGMAFAGTLWAWGRYVSLSSDPSLPSPGRAEVAVLWILSASCLAVLAGYYVFAKLPSSRDPAWGLLLVFALGIGVGTLYKTYRVVLGARRTAPLLSIEGLMLWGTLIGFTALAIERGGSRGTGGEALAGESKPGDGVMHPAELTLAGPLWEFTAPDPGAFVSSGVLHGDYLFIAARTRAGKGALYCLDKRGQKGGRTLTSQLAGRLAPYKVAEFMADGDMLQPYSSPCIANGRLYIGEGFHGEQDCNLYSVDLSKLTDPDPKKRLADFWAFATPGEVESSPAVSGGKVYFGGGNNRFYCIDATVKDKEYWRFPPADYKGRLLRFCSGPAVADKRVFTGTGADRDQKEDRGETALFCLDADSGKQIWKVPVDLPAWASPTVVGPHVYFALGNGDIVSDANPNDRNVIQRAHPAGAVVCLEVESGKQVWRTDFPNGVLEKPAVDRHQIYVGCRDGNVYCLGRASGKQRWKTFMGSAVVAAPALAKCSECGATAAVYAIATTGRICGLDPATGRILWSYTLEGRNAHMVSSPRVEVIPTPEGDRRRIYFGAALGNGPSLDGQAVVYCLEDRVKER